MLEDLHWAPPAFLDLVEHIAGLARGSILVLALARPELLDTRPEWAGGRLSTTTLLLDSLAEPDARRLLAELDAGADLADERRSRILAAAGGNPLFLEQLVAAARERDDADIPDSIHALLAARLDALGDDERRVVQAAAVCGLSFPVAIVERLAERDAGEILNGLARRDFVEPDVPRMPGERRWAFRHALLRDEAYASIPKRRRATLHERVAAIVLELAGNSGLDVEEVVGGHLDAAYRALAEVAPAAPEGAELARAAASHLAAAGKRAHNEMDVRGAARLLGRAAELLPIDDPARMAFVPLLVDALSWTGEGRAAELVIDEAIAAADPADEHLLARLTVTRECLLLWDQTRSDWADVIDGLRRRIRVLEAADDHEMLAFAHVGLFIALERQPAVWEDARLPPHGGPACPAVRCALARELRRELALCSCPTRSVDAPRVAAVRPIRARRPADAVRAGRRAGRRRQSRGDGGPLRRGTHPCARES